MDLNLLTRLESYSSDLFKLPDRRRLAVISEGHPADENESLQSGTNDEVKDEALYDPRTLPPSRTGSFNSTTLSETSDVGVHEANGKFVTKPEFGGNSSDEDEPDSLGAETPPQSLAPQGSEQEPQGVLTTEEAHYEDLWAAITRNIGKGFVLGYAGRVFLNSLFPLLNLVRGRRLVVTRKVLFTGAREYGLFLGSLLAIYNGGMFASRSLHPAWLLLRRYRAFISGLCAGSALFWIPREARWPITLFAIVRAFELQMKVMARRKWVPTLQNGDTVLMSLASASMLHSWFFSPDTLDPSYVRFLNVHSQMPKSVRDSLTRIYTGEPLDIDALNLARSHLKSGTARLLTNPYGADEWSGGELMHPTMPLLPYSFKFFAKAMTLSVPVYLPVFSVPVLLFYPQSLIKRPVPTIKRVLEGVLRSSVFLSMYCTVGFCSVSFMRSLGLTRAKAGKFGQIIYMLAGIWAGAMTMIEKKGRRIELALYVLSKAVEGRWNYVVSRGWVRPFPHGEVLVFAYCFAVVTHCYARHPYFIRSAYLSILSKFLDTDKRHKFYTMPRIVSERLLPQLSSPVDDSKMRRRNKQK